MAWFKKEKTPKLPQADRRLKMPEGLWVKCEACKEIVYKKEVSRNANVCPKCNFHFRISARERLSLLLDDSAYEEFDADIAPRDPLSFPAIYNPKRKRNETYLDKLKEAQRATRLNDALISCTARLGGYPVVVGIMEFAFIGGSMGSVVGEKVTRCAEKALDEGLPLIVFCCSGGARMQEGALSLMQMAKISTSLARLAEASLPYIAVLTHPTTGGVTASFAMLGDLILAEPRALIGFAGPRVIEQTIRQQLPEGFQRSEFLLEHGMVDMVVDRSHMRESLISCLRFMIAQPETAAARS